MKKSLLTVLAALSVVTAACSNNGNTAETNEPPANAEPAASSDPVKEPETDEKPKLSLRFMTPVGSASANATLPAADKDFVKQAIEEKFNVDLKLDYMVGGEDYKNKMNVQLAGGDIPDIFIGDGAASQKYATDGLLADLTPYLNEQTTPNYFKWVRQQELDSYQLKGMNFNRGILPFMRNQYPAWYVRQDWLDKLNLKAPTSYDEMIEVMRQFTNNDPDGNGKKDTYGFSTSGNGASVPLEFPQWLANGFVADFQIVDNKFVDNRTDLGVQKVIQDIIDINNEGIIDPDWFLSKTPGHLDKAAQGKIGIFFSGDQNVALEGAPNSMQARTKALIPEANWQPFNPFPDKPAIWKYGVPETSIMVGAAVAEKKPENIQRSFEILNWLAGEEGYLLTHYGQEGKHYTKEGNTITLIPEAYDADIANAGNWLGIYRFFTPEEPSVLGLDVIDPRVSPRDQAILKTVASFPKHDALPPITLAPPEGMNIGDLRKEMNKLHIKMIFEDKSADKWPQYREELMTKFKGREIFQGYTDQINSALKDNPLDAFQ
ncbi:extracellular solute-binding protein [Paenibacillus methanolicus]|uniref:ABC-type glycerol-3-phosphate transport system substrate-binding protein n=1 Tax=Paenibacillus methanolicus TaxID=582686 RepID=A0A5S5CB45_9BACL|nr:extracellular solute-binding protein [Paenibacillus methanolicus]TYP76574.1 ABC-type glycerol-3-phosphate transport system substrate-binding protein [Paenibacillus methanolicus]